MIKTKDLGYLLTMIIVILSLSFWSFAPFGDYINTLNMISIGLILLGFMIFPSKKNTTKLNYKKIIIVIILLRLLSIIPAYFFHNQGFFYSLAMERTLCLWLFYFFLHRTRLSPDSLIKIVLFIATVWALLTIIQQFTYPIYAFASREDTDTGGIEYRAGIYRFMVNGLQYGVLMGLMYLTYYFTEKKKKYIFYPIFFLVAIYFYSARQFIVGYIIACLSLVFFLKGNKRIIAIVTSCFFIILLYFTYDTIFGNYIVQTQKDFNEDNIRLLALNFFGIEYFPHWICNLFGNGFPYSKSSYGIEYFEYINETMHLYRTDVGIIGTYNLYGIFYCILIIYSFCRVFSFKLLPRRNYLKLFAVYVLSLIILSEYSYNNHVIPFFCIYFYLIDCYVEEYKKISHCNTCI